MSARPILQEDCRSDVSMDSFPLRYARRGRGRALVRGRYQGCWDSFDGPISPVSIVPSVSPGRFVYIVYTVRYKLWKGCVEIEVV